MLDKKLHDNKLKIASAIGKIQATGVIVAPPDINESKFTFSPDIKNNTIRYGLSGITRIGGDLIKTIIAQRPYSSVEDFVARVKVSKPQMVNLIKSGAFDSFGDRVGVMRQYIESVSDTKKRITLQNMKMLIDFGLIPDEFDMVKRVYNFTKYLKKAKIGETYYGLDNIAFAFYSNNFEVDKLVACEKDNETESGFKVKQTYWDTIYKKYMDKIRPWVQKNAPELLKQVNDRLVSELWDKYCLGSLSKWEMDSISCYNHEHELACVDNADYGFSNFFELDEQPEIERVMPIKGKMIPMFKLVRIAGTVLDRDKAKKMVTLLTTDGVVTVKVYGGVFQQYDKQISQRGADGKKHVIEKSVFARGNKIIVTGIRQDDAFVAKTYSRTPHHRIEQITDISNNGLLTIKTERAGE